MYRYNMHICYIQIHYKKDSICMLNVHSSNSSSNKKITIIIAILIECSSFHSASSFIFTALIHLFLLCVISALISSTASSSQMHKSCSLLLSRSGPLLCPMAHTSTGLSSALAAIWAVVWSRLVTLAVLVERAGIENNVYALREVKEEGKFFKN